VTDIWQLSGGENALRRVAKGFFEEVWEDDRVKHLFDKNKAGKPLDKPALIIKVAKTLAFCLGAPRPDAMFWMEDEKHPGVYRKLTLQEALEFLKSVHWDLQINDAQYQIVGQILIRALMRNGRPNEVTTAVAEVLLLAMPYIASERVKYAADHVLTTDIFFPVGPTSPPVNPSEGTMTVMNPSEGTMTVT
jgi:hypothetical protein